jgi:hypothetical protein
MFSGQQVFSEPYHVSGAFRFGPPFYMNEMCHSSFNIFSLEQQVLGLALYFKVFTSGLYFVRLMFCAMLTVIT